MTPVRARFLRSASMAALLLCPLLAGAQGAATVPLDDPAYAYLDRLEELGVVTSAVMGQRPYSAREFLRLAREASVAMSGRSLSADESRLVSALISRVEGRLERAGTSRLPVIDAVAIAVTTTDAARRGFPSGPNRLVEASIDPLAYRRLGEPVPPGSAAYLEVAQRYDPASWLSLHARERLQTVSPREDSPARSAELLLAGARARFRNVALSVGREQFAWGQGAYGGLFLSFDAPALDLISLASDRPFTLPSFLGRLGPTQATLLVADLGASRTRSHSKLVTYKVSVRPHRDLEVGGTFQNHFGGEGALSSPTLERLIDFLPFVDIFRRHNYTDSTLDIESDKVLGADARLRLERLGGVLLAGEWLIDDFDAQNLSRALNATASHSFSLTIPRIASPALSLTLIARHMGVLTYSHASMSEGLTTRGRLLGDELGPNAKAFGGELRWIPSPELIVTLEGRSAIYSTATYFISYPSAGSNEFLFLKLSHGPDELRDLALATLALRRDPWTTLFIRGGAERIRNVALTGGRRRDYVADIALRWQP